jgi:putative aldouronate transport system substrate-binding protein
LFTALILPLHKIKKGVNIMKKILAIVLSLTMMLSLSVSASAFSKASSKPNTSKFVTLTWMYEGNNVTNDKAVMAKVNEYLKKKLNCNLVMKWEGWGTFEDKQILAVNAGDPIDIYFTSGWTKATYAAMAKKGAFMRLDDPKNNILKNVAPNLFKTLPSVLAQAAMVKGANGMGIYAIPTYKEIAQQYVWSFNKAIIDKYGIKPSQVTDLKSLEPLLKKIKEGEGPDFYPINTDFTVWERALTNTDMVDASMDLDYVFNPTHPAKSGTQINSRYESVAFKNYVNTMHQYYLDGYINPAATTNKQAMNDTWTKTLTSGKWAFEIYPYYPGNELTQTSQYGYKFEVKPVQAGIISSVSSQGAMNAVSVTSKNPDRALALLNLVNTDSYLRTLLAFGVEGVHYTKINNRVSIKPNNGFTPWVAGLGNVNILPLKVGDPLNLYKELFPKFNHAEALPILGYSFDQDPVKTQMATLNNYADQYNTGLLTGASDPATVLPEYIGKLKSAGIDAVVKEANNQLKAFLAAKNKK